jgi:palmitoyl-protein thioesterase
MFKFDPVDDCVWYDGLLKLGIFNPLVHTKIVQAQYYKSHQVLEQYLRVNRFLTDINNELDMVTESYRQNLSSLVMFVMFMFENDTVVVPKESSVPLST